MIIPLLHAEGGLKLGTSDLPKHTCVSHNCGGSNPDLCGLQLILASFKGDLGQQSL